MQQDGDTAQPTGFSAVLWRLDAWLGGGGGGLGGGGLGGGRLGGSGRGRQLRAACLSHYQRFSAYFYCGIMTSRNFVTLHLVCIICI